MTPQLVKYNTFISKLNKIDVHNLSMKVKDVVNIFYVAVRGKDNEEGAVQRVLNKARVRTIAEYVLEGNDFFNTVILNWTDTNYTPQINNNQIIIPVIPRAAQVIDGQHRLAGLKQAFDIDNSIGDREIPVSLCIGLTTVEAARIFVNINSEQKPVNRSLIYDLFGVIDDKKDFPVNRATDIAQNLNENPTSAYYRMIKIPGTPRGEGFVDLSAIVNVLKNYIKRGEFEKHRLNEFNIQETIFLNYFEAIRFFYEAEEEGMWQNKNKNPFARNAGAVASIDFLMEKLIDKCKEKKSFKVETFKELLNLEPVLYANEIKDLGGTAAQVKIREFLESNLLEKSPAPEEYAL